LIAASLFAWQGDKGNKGAAGRDCVGELPISWQKMVYSDGKISPIVLCLVDNKDLMELFNGNFTI
jgi:hypothetical protein